MRTKGKARKTLFASVLMTLAFTVSACGGGSAPAAQPAPAPAPAKTPDAPKPAETAKPAPAEKQKLVLYTGRDNSVTDVVMPKFKEKYPNIDVEIVLLGAQQILERVRAEKTNPQGDFWWGGTSAALTTAAEEGLLDTVKPAFGDKIPAQYKDAKDRWYGEMLLPEVIMYNTEAIKKEDAPKDWDDVIDPKYKNKVIIRDVLPSGTMRTIYGAMIYRQSPTDFKKGYDWLLKLDANTKEYAADPTAMLLKLARQEGTIGLWNLQDVMFQKVNKKLPLDFVYPASGAPILVDGVGVIKGAKNKDAAVKFYDFLFEPKLRAELAETLFQIPTREDISKDTLPSWLKGLDLKPLPLDWNVMTAKDKEWMEYWDQNIKGKGKK